MLQQERQEGGGGSPRLLAEKLLSSDLQKLLAARPASPSPGQPPVRFARRSFARPGQPRQHQPRASQEIQIGKHF